MNKDWVTCYVNAHTSIESKQPEIHSLTFEIKELKGLVAATAVKTQSVQQKDVEVDVKPTGVVETHEALKKEVTSEQVAK